MMPIVNGLEDEFSDRVLFLRLNAADGADGETAFKRLSLPGHPSFVIFTPDGQEQERLFGVVDVAALRTAIESVLEDR
jgi:thiol:disulfide interchange protein